MCGIAGIIGPSASYESIEQMVKAMNHRGPDSRGSYYEPGLALGHTRLSIIDLSLRGSQPMRSVDGRYIIVFNGEIYNYLELRRQFLPSQKFYSNTDTETVLYLFIKLGKNCLKHLRGMFAFALWDTRKGTLFMARDQLGIKPLLYYSKKDIFIFCSEVKGMLASGLVEKKLSNEGLSLFLQKGYIAPPYTAIHELKALEPGHSLCIKNGRIQFIERYWDLTKSTKTVESYPEVVKHVRDLILDSTSEEMISDVPLGVFLSGGLDSSVVVSAMKVLGASRIDTFSIGFESSKEDETLDAAESARSLGTNHHQIIVNDEQVLKSFDHFIFGLDQPSIDGLNTYLVSQAARQNVTVALSGLGGDELFAGYSWQHMYYKKSKNDLILGRLLAPFENILPIFGTLGDKTINHFINYSTVDRFYKSLHLLFRKEFINDHLSCSLKTDINVLDKGICHYAQLLDTSCSRLQAITKLDMQYFMTPRLLRDSDAVSMSHSLEVRFPLIDNRLVEYVWNLPDDYKIQHHLNNDDLKCGFENNLSYETGRIKKLLYDAFEPELPGGLPNRSKRGFKMPVEKWMKGLLSDRVICSFHSLADNIFTSASAKVLSNAWTSNNLQWNKAWALLVLQSWMEQNRIHV